MDPDVALSDLRDAADEYLTLSEDPEGSDYRRLVELGQTMAEHFTNLDDWLTKGGFLPTPWVGTTQWVLTIKQISGDRVTVHASEAGATAELLAYVRRNWDDDGPGSPDVGDEDSEPIPDDADEAIATYFDCNADDERFNLESTTVKL